MAKYNQQYNIYSAEHAIKTTQVLGKYEPKLETNLSTETDLPTQFTELAGKIFKTAVSDVFRD